MTLWRYYFRAVSRHSFYLFTLLAALFSAFWLRGQGVSPSADVKGMLAIVYLIAAYVLAFLIDPRKLLMIHPFVLSLPAVRKRLSLVLWGALSLPLLTLLWSLYGFSIFWGAHALSLLELSLLANGSVLAWVLLPLPIVTLTAVCTADRWPLFLLLGLPYLVSGALWLGRHLPSRHWRGFRYRPSYAAPIAAFLLAFDLYQRSTQTAMRFRIGDDFIGLSAPDFNRLFLFLLFLVGGILFLLLPFLNVFALRQVDIDLEAQRRMTGTPWTRRRNALLLAVLLNLPLILGMAWLDFVEISPARLWHLGFAAACFNVLFPTGHEGGDWAGYALVGYLVWANLVSSPELWWLRDLALGGVALLAYDMDLWLLPVLQEIRRRISAFSWQ